MPVIEPGARSRDIGEPPSRRSRARDLAIALVLVAATFAVYAPVRRFAFLNLDDDLYVTENPEVRAGLTAHGLRWALTAVHGATWHPLTSLSHMADCELFGLDPGPPHVVNVALHGLNAALLFYAFRRSTGAAWPSAFAALLFALHPLHVESVAWVAERKDVLSTALFFLTILAYAAWVERGGARRYAGVAVFLALGLLAKPMLVTTPFVLLLLDYWPLRRSDARSPARLVAEKVPLFALAAGASVVAVVTQQSAGALGTSAGYPLGLRVSNALVATVAYLEHTFWPVGLAVFYPYEIPSAGQVATAAVLLIAITVACAGAAARRPYLLVGWLWFLGTLVPVIGLVQVGEQAMADRYTYLPLVGVFVALAWLVADIAGESAERRALAAVAGVALAGACALGASRQVATWRDNESLFRHALDVTSGNYLAATNLGVDLLRRGDAAGAREQFAIAVAAKPRYTRGYLNLGLAELKLGDAEGASAHLATALELDPADATIRGALAQAHQESALALERRGQAAQAIVHYREVARLLPDVPGAQLNLALALIESGKREEGIDVLRAAAAHWPDSPDVQKELARALAAPRS